MPRTEIIAEDALIAIAEFDAIGRNAFLNRYCFDRAQACFLSHNGRNYHSKAIASAGQ